MDEITKDKRFKHVFNDQKFKSMPRKDRKFKVDNRFKNMFSDKKFKLKYTVDKRGRPVNMTTDENLKKFYDLESDEDDEKDEAIEKNDQPNEIEKIPKNHNETEEQNGEDESSSSSSEESEESDDEEVYEQNEEIPWNEFDKDTKRSDDISRRLAVCNMDWDRIKANDLFVLFGSFKPANGVIKSIKIYLSEYGKERMEYERIHGPQELTESNPGEKNGNLSGSDDEDKEKDEDENLDEDEEGNKFNRQKLRIYQFNRLKYYYAIVECDSSETANRIYTECDGMEYESSCSRLDLRFVPDDMEFDDEPAQTCFEAPDPITYEPNLFFTTALNQTKVECTWDETPRDRLSVTMKKYTEEDLKKADFKNILATSSEEEDDDVEESRKSSGEINNLSKPKNDEERLQMYKNLLLGQNDGSNKKNKNREADLEFSWGNGMDDAGLDDMFAPQSKSQKKKMNKDKKNEPELTQEQKIEEAQLSLLTMDDQENKAHFNLDDLIKRNTSTGKKKTKGKHSKQTDESDQVVDDFRLNVNDPRFEAIFNDHKYNIDPSDSSFKKTKAMETLIDEKIKRKQPQNDDMNAKKTKTEEIADKSNSESSNLSLLVKSIKSKTEILQRKKNEANKVKKHLRYNVK